MKNLTGLLLASGIALGAAGCQSFKGATATVAPNPLEVHADSVKAAVRATVPPKSGFSKKAALNANLVLRKDSAAGSPRFAVGTVAISQTDPKYTNIGREGGVAEYRIAQPYQEGMNGTRLVVESQYVRGSRTTDLPVLDLAPCCITTSRLLYMGGAEEKGFGNDTTGSNAAYTFDPRTPVNVEGTFQFPKDVFAIQRGDYRREEIIALGNFLKKKYNATNVTISGFASPEGPYARNQMLSINRSRSVQRWLTEQLRREGYNQYLDSNFFRIVTTSEDWDGFKANLDQTTYSEDIKRQVIEIVSAGYEEDEKERRIMSLVGGANRVERILAPLRRARVRIDGFNMTRTDAYRDSLVTGYLGGRVPSDSLRSQFSQEEYLYAIGRQQTAADRTRLYQEYSRAYPNDPRVYNVLGANAAREGNYDNAYQYYSTANEKKANDPATLNRLAYVQIRRGNYTDAMTFAEQSYAAQRSPESAFNLGVLNARMGRYQRAAQYFDEAGTVMGARYNGGLTKLLMNDVAGARTDLDAAIRANNDRALNYYVLAVLGARAGDTALMTTNLRMAVDRDRTLAAKAQQDLEFRAFMNSAEFKAATSVQ